MASGVRVDAACSRRNFLRSSGFPAAGHSVPSHAIAGAAPRLSSRPSTTAAPRIVPTIMGYVGERLASGLGGLSWPTLYVTLIVLYVVIHYLFVSQTSQVLALFGVFLDVGTRGGVPLPLMTFGLLFASSYFSVITPQGGSQNIIFAASGYLTQRELYKLGLLVTLAFLAIYLLVGSPWVYLVTR